MNRTSLPHCVGIIMDGNRRWAKARGLPTLEGHRQGYEKLKETVRWVKDAGIGCLVVYAFSTENWNRTAEEVSYLMDLIRLVFTQELKQLKKDGIRIRCVGDRSRFSKDIQELMENAERQTAAGDGPTLALALSYGGRPDILNAVNKLLASGAKNVTERDFSDALWTKDIPDPDLIIRTGGEKRLSGFLTWQSVYSELFFVDTYLPDFSKEEFQGILAEFNKRERRMGK